MNLCVGQIIVLNENVTVSKTFNDQGKHFFCQYLDVDLRVLLDTFLDEKQMGLRSSEATAARITPVGFVRRKWSTLFTCNLLVITLTN